MRAGRQLQEAGSLPSLWNCLGPQWDCCRQRLKSLLARGPFRGGGYNGNAAGPRQRGAGQHWGAWNLVLPCHVRLGAWELWEVGCT